MSPRRDRSFFLVTAHVQVVVVRAAIRQPVNQPRIAVIREDDRLVFREQLIEVDVAQPVRMLGRRLQLHQIDDVDDADLQ